MRRWLVERFFGWIQWQRRILVRWEYHTQNFLGFSVLQRQIERGKHETIIAVAQLRERWG